jgi:hypothetical protein
MDSDTNLRTIAIIFEMVRLSADFLSTCKRYPYKVTLFNNVVVTQVQSTCLTTPKTPKKKTLYSTQVFARFYH